MNLTALIRPETVLLPLDAESKPQCIEKLAAAMRDAGYVTDAAAFVEAVMKREQTGSTGVGFGVAIPHGKSEGVARPGLAFAKLSEPVDWNSLDGKPVSMVFLIAVPQAHADNEHLQVLAAISRKLMHESFRNRLAEAASANDVIAALEAL
ncbi:PTS sugar transporter subunit IIA [Effusibacillus pohliae]|uniref:PTS sugar transporter subunit IIA n=1 Tax=Effusibacillus pohliae TaxID=232270 RepID=UPI00037198C3|nr:fructose PTS transporter subunit IIA [Effusibacillus pohliae]